ncbi:hypothetical protein OAV62_01285, partial [bacterium]|nr:hypothetical protein [bacterium]
DNELEVAFQEKANGKMATFKIFDSNGERYLFGGSKNVHILTNILDEVNDNGELSSEILWQIQCDLKDKTIEPLVGKTIFGEHLDGKHMVYEDTPHMVYFAVHGERGTTLLDAVGLRTPTIIRKITHMPTEDEYSELRLMKNSEGVVVVYTNTRTGALFRQKHKTLWYIFIRVMREALRRYGRNVPTATMLNVVGKKFRERNNSFLHQPQEIIDEWVDTARNFIQFVKSSKFTFRQLAFDSGVGMAVVWHDFLNTDPSVYQNIDKLPPPHLELDQLVEMPSYVRYGLKLVEMKIPVCFIMRGPSGSGKSSTADLIKEMSDESVDIFSTDAYFTGNDGYHFDSSKLREYHQSNFEDFKGSRALVRIVDNTNLKNEYMKYTNCATQQGCVSIVVDMKKDVPESYSDRTIHGISLKNIKQMIDRWRPAYPNYYGIFLSKDELVSFTSFTQKTPLHVTCKFAPQPNEREVLDPLVGLKVEMPVLGVNRNSAGKCLIVDVDFSGYLHTETPHVTLETYENYKPSMVGKNIKDGSMVLLNGVTIAGIFGPLF